MHRDVYCELKCESVRVRVLCETQSNSGARDTVGIACASDGIVHELSRRSACTSRMRHSRAPAKNIGGSERTLSRERGPSSISTSFLRPAFCDQVAKSYPELFAFELAKSYSVAFCECFLHRKESPKQRNLRLKSANLQNRRHNQRF